MSHSSVTQPFLRRAFRGWKSNRPVEHRACDVNESTSKIWRNVAHMFCRGPYYENLRGPPPYSLVSTLTRVLLNSKVTEAAIEMKLTLDSKASVDKAV